MPEASTWRSRAGAWRGRGCVVRVAHFKLERRLSGIGGSEMFLVFDLGEWAIVGLASFQAFSGSLEFLYCPLVLLR